MSDSEPTAVTPTTRSAGKWNAVWFVPILAILIGGWMLYKSVTSKGPEIEVRFETAEGIVGGKTEIRCRSVTVGKVTRVELGEDLQSVLLHCRLDAGYGDLLKKGTRFWVVRPRVSAADISGLGTLLTGVYLELEPGTGKKSAKQFEGLELPPATSRSVPGRRLTLVSEEASSLSVGSPVYYRGYEVGRLESRKLDADGRRISYELFITEEYQSLVRSNSKFWKTSGIDVEAGVDGFRIRTPSLQAMVSGGVSFAVPDGIPRGSVAEDGVVYQLHESAGSAIASDFDPTLKLLLLFDQSVRGLGKDAPVEYRGITIGRVRHISFDYVPERENQKVPVMVEVDPRLLRASDISDAPEEEIARLGDSVRNGLRATLKTGSLLTGAMFVDFNYYPEEATKELTYQGDYPVVPTISSGFAQLEVKLASILEKIDSLPLDQAVKQITKAAEESATTITEARAAVKEIELAAASARRTLEDPELRELPADLRDSLTELEKSLASIGPDGTIQGDLLRTLDEFRSALRSMESLSDTIKDRPNSLLFGKEESKNPKPRAVGGSR